MIKKSAAFLTFLLCLSLVFSSLHAQQFVPIEQTGKVIRLYQENLPSDVDLKTYLDNGEVKLLSGLECLPPKVNPGPAPDPYPHIHMWEKGIEQLGATSVDCDGIWFVNGNLWHPNKIALVLWRIRIPGPSNRLASEFERDLTLSLWVDWNEDKMWGKNERMVNDNLNLQGFFPCGYSYLEVWYLSWFFVPRASTIDEQCGGGFNIYTAKLWARGLLSYDDEDASPDGECLFGEAEDYQITYFEVKKKEKKQY